jgi:catechol 2,3-dioxygenase-like lactoylglutathione lyase family enzyme
MISGAHIIIYTKDSEADRKFFKNVLGFKHVDSGGGWLIFALPPSELACHPHNKNNIHELYFMCKNIKSVIKKLKSKKIKCSEIHPEPWGLLSMITLPGGGKVGLYQPKHKMAVKMK